MVPRRSRASPAPPGAAQVRLGGEIIWHAARAERRHVRARRRVRHRRQRRPCAGHEKSFRTATELDREAADDAATSSGGSSRKRCETTPRRHETTIRRSDAKERKRSNEPDARRAVPRRMCARSPLRSRREARLQRSVRREAPRRVRAPRAERECATSTFRTSRRRQTAALACVGSERTRPRGSRVEGSRAGAAASRRARPPPRSVFSLPASYGPRVGCGGGGGRRRPSRAVAGAYARADGGVRLVRRPTQSLSLAADFVVPRTAIERVWLSEPRGFSPGPRRRTRTRTRGVAPVRRADRRTGSPRGFTGGPAARVA